MNWLDCKNLLIIRPDNLGDLLMSSPAIRAIKETFNCKITLLTSSVSAEAAMLIPEIDDVIVASVPWVRTSKSMSAVELTKLIEAIKMRSFDSCIIFTVYSQNPLPSALVAWLAGIPKRLTYCRENPYDLVNYWVPDKEPYTHINHQVERDLNLVEHIGCISKSRDIKVVIPDEAIKIVDEKLSQIIPSNTDFIVVHAGVSELKRAYPIEKWIEITKEIVARFNLFVLFTGIANEKPLTDRLHKETGEMSASTAGLFTIAELAALIDRSRLLISVNTGPVHIAAGLKKPVIVLYAQTNPQHKPWRTKSKIFEFSVNERIKSSNEVIRFVSSKLYNERIPLPEAEEVIAAIDEILISQSIS